MGREISQFDIPDHPLLTTKARPRMDMWTDIGEAKITRTIFGRAKVRVVLERDKKRLSRLLATLAGTVLVVAVWQGWIAWQQIRDAPTPLNETVRVSAPTFLPAYAPPLTTPRAERGNPKTMLQIEIDSLVTGKKLAPPQTIGLKSSQQIAAKPVTVQPLIAGKPKEASLATNNNASKIQRNKQQPLKMSPSTQPTSPAVATPTDTHAAVNQPASITPLAEPLIRESIPVQSPAGDNQPAETNSVQP